MPPISSCFFYFSLLLQILGFFFFLTGFLPIRSVGKYQDDSVSHACRSREKTDNSTQPTVKAKGQRLVLMVIDALREDFVFEGRGMPFLQRLINEKKTISFLAKSYPPTVTLPRIKSMVTGTVPGFIDVVINLASTELKEDNIIVKLNHMNKKINFFGDDTWLKLFPNCFMQHDGTTSFVVSDYKEVDDNVTKHLSHELQSNDWDVLILHFLGLDHIGHSSGPSSPLVGPKLFEMDQVVKQITEALFKRAIDSDQDSLFILTSDHGMNDAGSHGGASPSEILSPLVFTSPSMMQGNGEYFTKKLVNQVDLAPTIAAIFNFDIPENSVGAVIVDLLKFQSVEARKEKLIKNICQISKQSRSAGSALGTVYCNASQASLQNYTEQFLSGILKDTSLHLQKQSSEYQIDRMTFGLFFLCLSFFSAMIPFRACEYGAMDIWFGLLILLHSLLITSTSYIEEEHQFWYFAITTSVLIMFLSDQCTLIKNFSSKVKMSTKEQLLHWKHSATYFAIMVIFRIIRAWNQTGIKWLSQKDISSFLLLNYNRIPLTLLLFISLALISYLFFWKASAFYRTASAVAIILIYIHKIISLNGSNFWPFSINGITEARIVFAVCLIMLCKSITPYRVYKWKRFRAMSVLSNFFSKISYVSDNTKLQKTDKSIESATCKSPEKWKYDGESQFHAFLLLYMILQRPHNIVWLCLVLIMARLMNRINCGRSIRPNTEVSLAILHYCLGKASFHAQGHSNSLACVDISAAFVGVAHYSTLLSGFLTSIATYGSHVFWYFSLKRFIQKTWEENIDKEWTIRYIYNAILSLESIVLCSITYLNRYHLFIWTVFAPKFLFLLTFRVFMSIVIVIS